MVRLPVVLQEFHPVHRCVLSCGRLQQRYSKRVVQSSVVAAESTFSLPLVGN